MKDGGVNKVETDYEKINSTHGDSEGNNKEEEETAWRNSGDYQHTHSLPFGCGQETIFTRVNTETSERVCERARVCVYV